MTILVRVLNASWALLGEMAPFLLLGFFVAGLLSVFVSPEWVERHLGRTGWRQVVKAGFFGVPLPLCSCGVLPVAASLRRHGAGKGATTAFLLSTPQTGVDSIAVTWALLGPIVAVLRPVAAFVTGVLGGMVVQAVEPENGETAVGTEISCTEECCSDEDSGSRLVKALRYGFITLPRDIGRALVIGLVLSGVIAAFVGPEHVELVFGGGMAPYFVAMAVGIPLYVCATASTPIAASLIGAGLSPGAALVFLISGPATNVASIATLLRVLGKRVVAVYLGTVVVGSLATGIFVDLVLGGKILPPSAIEFVHSVHDHGAGSGWGLEDVWAALLVIVLVGALWPRRTTTVNDGPSEDRDAGKPIELEISGMQCNGCVQSIERGLREIPGVEGVAIDLSSGTAVVIGSGLDAERLRGEVRSLGFDCQ